MERKYEEDEEGEGMAYINVLRRLTAAEVPCDYQKIIKILIFNF